MAKKGKVGRKAAKKPAPSGGRIPLKVIVAETGFGDGGPESTKRARVKLRRVKYREGSDDLTFHERGSRWDLTATEAKEVRAILSA
jgi:hypothetical protein